MKELIALLDGRKVGAVRHERNRLSFAYFDDWREAQGAYPLSLSMPLAAREHPHHAIEPFIWGLLPDNELILARWAKRFQVSARNAFALIAHVGEDCAGAVQFAEPERIDLLSAADARTEWLSELEIADRLRALKEDASAWRRPQDTGQFSLAGAQPKTALLLSGKRWGIPSGRTPTTHLLKPPTGGHDGHAENEHLCLTLARALGMPAAKSEVRRFAGETAIVIERYDRTRARGGLARIHQEDMCQALRVHPAKKYQNDGGPGPKRIIDLIRANVSPQRFAEIDEASFLDALIFNWLIGGTDAHAKNYSVLIGGGGAVRLAPLYDVASVLPYGDVDIRKAKLAMKIGDDYRLHYIRLAHWRELAAEIGVDPDALVGRVRNMATELPDRLSAEISRARADGLNHAVIPRLANLLSDRARRIAAA